MRNAPLRQVIFVLLAIAVAAAVFTSIAWWVTELADVSFKDAAAAVQGIGTLVILSVGGALAYYRFQMFRSFEPHLTVTHEVAHRRVGDSYVHISVNANLHNSSRVKVDIRKCYFRLQKIAPTDDSEVERLYDQVFVRRIVDEIQWLTLEYEEREWPDPPIEIEPGESHHEVFEFIVLTEIETVLIYTYFYNSALSAQPQGAEGWDATTIYDIVAT